MTDVMRQELAPTASMSSCSSRRHGDRHGRPHRCPKAKPADVAALALDGIESDLTEILADEITRSVKQDLSAPPARPSVVVA